MKNNYRLLAEIIEIERNLMGYSKRDFARKVGISHTELTRIENQLRENYNVVTLITMCRVLEIDFVRLLQVCGYLPMDDDEEYTLLEDILVYIEINEDEVCEETCEADLEDEEISDENIKFRININPERAFVLTITEVEEDGENNGHSNY